MTNFNDQNLRVIARRLEVNLKKEQYDLYQKSVGVVGLDVESRTGAFAVCVNIYLNKNNLCPKEKVRLYSRILAMGFRSQNHSGENLSTIEHVGKGIIEYEEITQLKVPTEDVIELLTKTYKAIDFYQQQRSGEYSKLGVVNKVLQKLDRK